MEFKKSFLRYLVSGTVAVTVHFVILITLIEKAHFNPTLSSGCGFVCGFSVNYLLQYYWAFQAKKRHIHALARYCGVTAVTMSVNLVVFWSLTVLVGLWYFYSQVFAIGVVVILNFLMNRAFTFG